MEKPQQDIQEIPLADLNLWSENPRDPIDNSSGDLDVVKNAIRNNYKKWDLDKLAKEMGNYYDFSELPTVVFQNNKYIVYDGNRRLAILKYLQNPSWQKELGVKFFSSAEPIELKNLSKIPCNVCNRETALINIRRKHINDGSWKQLERDFFEHRILGEEKSFFIRFDEATGLIRNNPELNENIMKNDILSQKNLREIGFGFNKSNTFVSMYDDLTTKTILDKIVELKKSQVISSRSPTKYNIKAALLKLPELASKLKVFKEEEAKEVNYPIEEPEKEEERRTRRQNQEKHLLFGGSLTLGLGTTNDIYRDIVDLHRFYERDKAKLSNTFPNLIRMALRLLTESASGSERDIDPYVTSNFTKAKQNLNKDEKTTLSNNSIDTDKRLITLLHTGAHNYSSSANIEQTIAMSLILGQMLKITHKKAK